jgi:hypothetical protein
MSSTRDEVLQAALLLPEADRVLIVNRLLDTLPDNLSGIVYDDPEFAAELERRSGDWKGAVPWEELKKELGRRE